MLVLSYIFIILVAEKMFLAAILAVQNVHLNHITVGLQLS